MKYITLVLKNALRSRRRTALTVLSVALAVFLFATLRAILAGFNAGAEQSSSTRIVTLRSTGLMFSMPSSHAQTIEDLPGVHGVTWANWFGGIYKDPANFFAQFAIEPESYLRLYPEIQVSPEEKKAFIEDRTGALVGDGLAKRFGFKVGDRVVLQVGIPVYGDRDFDFTVRGIYTAATAAVDNQSMFFHWKYADERSVLPGQAGWFVTEIDNPGNAMGVARSIDQKFANTPNETKTSTEREFASSFISMFGNLNLLLGSISLAVVVSTLFVAANTMAMSVRERTTEIAVMRTLGFSARSIFGFVAGEALFMSLVGGLVGAGLAYLIVQADQLGMVAAFIPMFGVSISNAAIGVGLSAVIGLLAGILPALMASRLRIVDALRRVA